VDIYEVVVDTDEKTPYNNEKFHKFVWFEILV